MHGRFLDPSTSVREAAIELVGKFILIRPDLIPQYYDMISERILVSTSVFDCLPKLLKLVLHIMIIIQFGISYCRCDFSCNPKQGCSWKGPYAKKAHCFPKRPPFKSKHGPFFSVKV